MVAGTWAENPRYVSFGDYNDQRLVWRVLEVKSSDPDFGGAKTAFLLLDELLRGSDGNVEAVEFGSSNSFPNSKISEWLNDGANGFMAGLGAYQADILDTRYSSGNGVRKWAGGSSVGVSKVYLLSVDEANNVKYFANDAERIAANKSWWLRSPGYGKDIAAVVIIVGSVARNGFYVNSKNCVRPALKINLSTSSIFADIPVSYRLTIKTDDGRIPISGAKISLASSRDAQIAESYTDSSGIARFANVTPGEYTIAISKPGYMTKSEHITAPAAPAISLPPDQNSIPGKVRFGKYNGNTIEWDVLDIVNGKALLFAGALFEMYFDNEGSSAWESSSLRAHLNSVKAGDFLSEANFTTAEAAAIDAAMSATGDPVFLLSSSEVYRYLPDAEMRSFNGMNWLMRTPFDGAEVEAISPSGDYCTIPAYERGIFGWSRPAMWVDLNALTYDSETNTLTAISDKTSPTI
jgi:hypothetical protein